ncbi:hypothetical protein BDA99DRAFT_499876 [Phascolomyces articulosus]|uniref:MINDY deubiquitinase domain-containing protein n=1 Tax=Phascolomyces articulosus TaxID=60185 RepID=A0AAD5PJJ8_9FUNG|nr:hypothetical protein BDA99DRAFT_499876 [Phascolomyces articulosus]
MSTANNPSTEDSSSLSPPPKSSPQQQAATITKDGLEERDKSETDSHDKEHQQKHNNEGLNESLDQIERQPQSDRQGIEESTTEPPSEQVPKGQSPVVSQESHCEENSVQKELQIEQNEQNQPDESQQLQQQSEEQPQQQPAEQDDAVQEYLVKKIQWFDTETKQKKDVLIITQNENGPCPLVAICNVLFLRGDLEIRPPDREMVTFEYLVERLGDYLLNHGPGASTNNNTADIKPKQGKQQQQQQQEEQVVSSPTQYEASTQMDRIDSRQSTAEYVLTYRYNLDAALSILPNLQMGLDVNVRFSSIRGFEPTAELAMFDLFDVDLVHGWLVDPQDEQTYQIIAEKCGSYNSVVECVVRGDTLSSSAAIKGDNRTSRQWSPDEERQIQEGLIAATFLEDTATQLTYHGLESLVSSIPSNKLCVLFRNNHFSTIYKHPETSTLYILVTDSGLVSEESIVWENLGDVDQGASEFFNSDFQKPEIIRSPPPPMPTTGDPSADMDYILALSLQQNEISNAEEHRRRRRQQQHLQHQQEQLQYQQQLHQQQVTEQELAAKRKKRQSCIIC